MSTSMSIAKNDAVLSTDSVTAVAGAALVVEAAVGSRDSLAATALGLWVGGCGCKCREGDC